MLIPDYGPVRALRGLEHPTITVIGVHNSGTRVHVQLLIDLQAANQLHLNVEHWSCPSNGVPKSDLYVVVQRNAAEVARSTASRRLGERSYPLADEFPGHAAQFWQGLAQIAARVAVPAQEGRVLHVWHDETRANPRTFATAAAHFLRDNGIGGPGYHIPAEYGSFVV